MSQMSPNEPKWTQTGPNHKLCVAKDRRDERFLDFEFVGCVYYKLCPILLILNIKGLDKGPETFQALHLDPCQLLDYVQRAHF